MQRPSPARTAILQTFETLMMTGRYSEFSVGRLCKEAGVGRSTFYMHFENRQAVLLSVLDPIIEDFAVGLIDRTQHLRACAVVEHIWEQRRLSELWRDAIFRDAFTDALSVHLQARGLGATRGNFASAGITAIFRHWTAGRLMASPADLTNELSDLI